MLNTIPVFGWIIDFLAKTSLALPFWIVWTKLSIGVDFFGFLPAQYHRPGFWETVGVFIVLGVLKGFSPFNVSASGGGGGEGGKGGKSQGSTR